MTATEVSPTACGCAPGACEGLCTWEAARQRYLCTLVETDKRNAQLHQLARDQTANLTQLRKEAHAVLATWLDSRDQNAAAQLQKLLNSWPCDRGEAEGSATSAGRHEPVTLRGAA